MAAFSQQFYLYLVLISISSLFLVMNLVFAGPTGFSLKLLHIDSLHPGRNLSQLQRMERAYRQTKVHEQQLTASSMNSSVRNNSSRNPNALRPLVFFYDHYIILLGIGTIPNGEKLNPEFYYLAFDTGSDLLWLQCSACTNCFPQSDPLFPWDKSTTFRHLPCDDVILCPTGECYDKEHLRSCKYSNLYGDGSVSTTGFLAAETLTVNTDNDPLGKVENFIFGCGMNQLNFVGMGETVGIMGLGGGMRSIINQLRQTKFEYCLVPWTAEAGTSTFLRFGSDTKIGAGGEVVHTTPMLFGKTSTLYYVKMLDISVAGTLIGYDHGELELKADGSGGCIFDTGTPYAYLSTDVFVPLRASLLLYFAGFDFHDPPPYSLYELCFVKPSQFNFPAIIFHFDGGADFEIETNAAFYIAETFFCLNILRKDGPGYSVVLGGIQQGNRRVLYDVGKLEISWSNANCVADS